MMDVPTNATPKEWVGDDNRGHMHRYFDGNQMFGMHPVGWGFWVLLILVALGAYAMARNKGGPGQS